MGVYKLVPRVKEHKAIATRWVFDHNKNGHGEITKFKARYVVRGFTQKYGFDYLESFSPVIKIQSVRILLSLANTLGWTVFQMDVKTAFLNSKLSDNIYVEQPECYKDLNFSEYVWFLLKALYGLKQSSREW